MSVFSSCAIHKEFPFFCFRPSCVKVALGVPQIKGWKKKLRGKAQIRRNKANSRESLKNKTDLPPRSLEELADGTTASPGNILAGSCDLIKMVFIKQAKVKRHQTDTFLVHFRMPENEIDELSQVQIRGYFLNNNKEQLVKIKLCYCCKEEKQNELNRGLYLQRTTNIVELLREKKISRRKIELE